MDTMKAVRLHDYGPPNVLVYEDAPRPQLRPGDVLVKVHAAAVNPVDAKIRSGAYKDYMPIPMPGILGWDVSGVIEQTNGDVGDFAAGDAVFSRPDISRPGAYAEYITVRAPELAKKPESLNHEEAASVPLAAGTAWQALFDRGGLEAGQTVLIHGASGGVGGFAVQLARWAGAVVYGTASARNREYVESLGALRFIDYKSEQFEDVVKDADMVLDTMGGETVARSWSVLRPGGILVSQVDHSVPEQAKERGLRGANFMMQPDSDQLTQIGGLIDRGLVTVRVQDILPLRDAARAHEMIETGHTRGKIVLKVV